jgi:hypothetical protein
MTFLSIEFRETIHLSDMDDPVIANVIAISPTTPRDLRLISITLYTLLRAKPRMHILALYVALIFPFVNGLSFLFCTITTLGAPLISIYRSFNYFSNIDNRAIHIM